MSCDDANHCVTCSDEALPLRVVELRDGTAVCEDDVEVLTDLVGPVDVGDVLLVHAGVALAKLHSQPRGRRLDGGRPFAEAPASPAPER